MRKPVEILTGYRCVPRLRIFAGQELVLGSGMILLLRLTQETGSISGAARRMQMSYNHAWILLQVMNRSFTEPLVEGIRSGKRSLPSVKCFGTIMRYFVFDILWKSP